MALPKILKHYNAIVNGYGFLGRMDEIELPKLTIKTEDHRGGVDVDEKIDMGMEGMECSFTSAEHDAVIYEQFGLTNGNAVGVTFRASNVDDSGSTPYVVTVRGKYTELDPGSLKSGEKTPLKATLALTYYKLEMDGRTLIEIDVRNMKRIINGVDQLAKMRADIQA